MNRQIIVPKGMEAVVEKMGYAPALRIGDTVYVAGQIGRDEQMRLVEAKEAQFVQVFENIKKILEAAGATFDDLVEVTSFHTDMRDLPLYIQVRNRYFGRNCPPWTAIGAASLGSTPGCFVEVKVIAVIGSGQRRDG